MEEHYYERNLFDSKKIILSRDFYCSLKNKKEFKLEMLKNCIEKIILEGGNKRHYAISTTRNK